VEKEELRKLIEDDDLGLLNVKPTASSAATEDERLLSSFEEILNFCDQHGREPKENFDDITEHMLFSRLLGIREDAGKIEAIREFDRLNLLNLEKPVQNLKSIKDILADDDMGLLDTPESSIFKLKNIPEIRKSEYIGRRKQCEDFSDFETFFLECQSEIRSGRRKILPFQHDSSIKVSQFYIHNGVLLYVAEFLKEEFRDHKDRNREDFRLRCVYENGTESDILRNSLGKRLRENGRRVTDHEDRMLDVEPEEGDVESGFIYILKSLSENLEIQNLANLYKIGFSRGSVEERIKNAESSTTYLMAPVKIIATYQCYNMNSQKFELLLHKFFGGACLDIDVFDEKNKRHTPREWFVVPLQAIEETIDLVITGNITDYAYDAQQGRIILKPESADSADT
jgi:hypothetical protein